MQATHPSQTAGTDVPPATLVGGDQRFRSLFDRNPAAVLLLDREGRIVEANPALQARFGHDPLGLRGQPLSWLLPDWDRPELLADLAKGDQTHDAVLRHAHGKRCEVVVALLAADADGSDAEGGYFLIARDVTSQRRLRRQMHVQAEILARIDDAVVVLDEVGAVVCWNVGAERLYGATSQAMAGQAFAAVFDPVQHLLLHQALAEAGLDSASPTQLQLRCTGPQSRTTEVLLSLSRIAGVEPGSELWVAHAQKVAACHRAAGADNEPSPLSAGALQ